MSKVAILTVATALLTVGLAGYCAAQGTAIIFTPVTPAAQPGQLLYNGQAIGDGGLQAIAWGGGTVTQDDTTVFGSSSHSLKIESPGFYQGAQIVFGTPIDLGNTSDRSRYFEIAIKLASDPKFVKQSDANSQSDSPNAPGVLTPPTTRQESFNGLDSHLLHLAQGQYGPPPGAFGPPPGAYGPPAGAFPGGRTPGMQPPAGVGTNQQEDEPAPPALPAKFVHLIFSLSDGTQSDAIRILPDPVIDQDWIHIALPISKIVASNQGTQPKLLSVIVCTDSPTFINVGQIRLVSDTTPITATTGGEKDVSASEEVVFNGKGSAGASMLSYQWDFETNGPFVAQADSSYATHTFAKAGAYTVTLVVSDIDGIKAPATATTIVHVEN